MNSYISLLEIVEDTTVDGPGLRTAIYVAGRPHHCYGCHNPQSWNINNGTKWNVNDILNVILQNELANVTFTGSDPFFQPQEFTALAKLIRKYTNKTIWCNTEYTFEYVNSQNKLKQLLQLLDVLVDGKFVQQLYDEALVFKGSANQRIIKVKQSIEKKQIVLWKSEL
jgi:anaerobic ribonucleoside-triphosphate reductase activating protein